MFLPWDKTFFITDGVGSVGQGVIIWAIRALGIRGLWFGTAHRVAPG
jgi:hypothetical protein